MDVESVTTITPVAREGFGTLEVGVDPTADVAAVLADVEGRCGASKPTAG